VEKPTEKKILPGGEELREGRGSLKRGTRKGSEKKRKVSCPIGTMCKGDCRSEKCGIKRGGGWFPTGRLGRKRKGSCVVIGEGWVDGGGGEKNQKGKESYLTWKKEGERKLVLPGGKDNT